MGKPISTAGMLAAMHLNINSPAITTGDSKPTNVKKTGPGKFITNNELQEHQEASIPSMKHASDIHFAIKKAGIPEFIAKMTGKGSDLIGTLSNSMKPSFLSKFIGAPPELEAATKGTEGLLGDMAAKANTAKQVISDLSMDTGGNIGKKGMAAIQSNQAVDDTLTPLMDRVRQTLDQMRTGSAQLGKRQAATGIAGVGTGTILGAKANQLLNPAPQNKKRV